MLFAALIAASTACAPVAHAPDALVMFRSDQAAPADLNPGVEINASLLTVPVMVDVLRPEREVREAGLLGELKLADIPVVDTQPSCSGSPAPKKRAHASVRRR